MACPARLLRVGELILWSGRRAAAVADGRTVWLVRRFNMSRVVGSEIAGRMILDKLAGKYCIRQKCTHHGESRGHWIKGRES
jgi:hypothetical protein